MALILKLYINNLQFYKYYFRMKLYCFFCNITDNKIVQILCFRASLALSETQIACEQGDGEIGQNCRTPAVIQKTGFFMIAMITAKMFSDCSNLSIKLFL